MPPLGQEKFACYPDLILQDPVGVPLSRVAFPWAVSSTRLCEKRIAAMRLPSIPKEGDSFGYRGLDFTVSAMQHNRILKLTVRISPDIPADGEGGEAQ